MPLKMQIEEAFETIHRATWSNLFSFRRMPIPNMDEDNLIKKVGLT